MLPGMEAVFPSKYVFSWEVSSSVVGSKLALPSKNMNVAKMPFEGNSLSSRYLKEPGSRLNACRPGWIRPDARLWVPAEPDSITTHFTENTEENPFWGLFLHDV